MATLSAKYNVIPPLASQSSATKELGYCTQKLWSNHQLVNRLLYRSHNQHRASFALHRLKEVKRLGERIARLELWLKDGRVETGRLLFDHVGYLNTLRLLIEKAMEACGKCVYFYTHYLDQALFVPLAIVAVGTVSGIHKEYRQWLKYVHLLYASGLQRLRAQHQESVVDAWMREHFLPHPKDMALQNETRPQSPSMSATQSQPASSPSPSPSSASQKRPFNKAGKKTKRSKSFSSAGNDEIDDIFNSL